MNKILCASIIMLAFSSAAFCGEVRVRSGEHQGYTRVAVNLGDNITYNVSIGDTVIEVALHGTEVSVDIGDAMERLNSGRVLAIDFDKNSKIIAIQKINNSLVRSEFYAPYLYFDIYSSVNVRDVSSNRVLGGFPVAARLEHLTTQSSGKRLMKSYFVAEGGAFKAGSDKSTKDSLRSIEVFSPVLEDARVDSKECVDRIEDLPFTLVREFLADIRGSRRFAPDYVSVDQLEIFRKWGLISEMSSLILSGREIEIDEPSLQSFNAAKDGKVQDCWAVLHEGDIRVSTDERPGKVVENTPTSSSEREPLVEAKFELASVQSSQFRDDLFYQERQEDEDPNGGHNQSYPSTEIDRSKGSSASLLGLEEVADESFYRDILAGSDADQIYLHYSAERISRLSSQQKIQIFKIFRDDGFGSLEELVLDRSSRIKSRLQPGRF